MTLEQLKQLALQAAKREVPSTDFSMSQVNSAVLDGMKELVGEGYHNWNMNKHLLFQVIEQVADEVVPQRMSNLLGLFAEIQTVPDGQTYRFRVKRGRQRAKLYVTTAALSGLYETFRLDSDYFQVGMSAIGGATIIDFERMLSGAESVAENMDVLIEGMADAVLRMVQTALVAAATDPLNVNIGTNVVTEAGFDASEMVKLVNIARAYGGNATIFATPEFIAEMGPDAIVPVATGTGQGVYSPDDIDAIHKTGYIQIFRGAPIVRIQQSFVDDTNTLTTVNPQFAYVMPSGQDKPVKVLMEGGTRIREWQNYDGSVEIHAYRKIGVGITAYNNWGIYQNTDITDTTV